MIYTNKEVEAQHRRLYRESDSLGLSDWERKFLEDLADQSYPWTAKQRETVSKLYLQHLDGR